MKLYFFLDKLNELRGTTAELIESTGQTPEQYFDKKEAVAWWLVEDRNSLVRMLVEAKAKKASPYALQTYEDLYGIGDGDYEKYESEKGLDINEGFREAIALINAGKNVYITGKAGTGKSTLLRYIREPGHAVVAPTGVAALNVQGVTIHSLFQAPTHFLDQKILSDIHPKKVAVILAIKTLIIDEVSMVRADLMDYIDRTFRSLRGNDKPFGGVQILLFGDLHQLAPVVNKDEVKFFSGGPVAFHPGPYFFNSNVFKWVTFYNVTLTKIYRQTEKTFIDVLNNIRESTCTQRDFEILNERLGQMPLPDQKYITLCVKNDIADAINGERLSRIHSNPVQYKAVIEGKFYDEKNYPAPGVLILKVGAQVMFVRNDAEVRKDEDGHFMGAGRRWVNGTLGVVYAVNKDNVQVQVGDCVHTVESVKWERHEYGVGGGTEKKDKEGKVIGRTVTVNVVGSFKQIPLKLAWAITIHKSQGKTFNYVKIDLGQNTFAHGQLYVALSRCTTLGGIILIRAVRPADVKFDDRILAYENMIKTDAPLEDCSPELPFEGIDKIVQDINAVKVE